MADFASSILILAFLRNFNHLHWTFGMQVNYDHFSNKDEVEDSYQPEKIRCPCGSSLRNDSIIKVAGRISLCNLFTVQNKESLVFLLATFLSPYLHLFASFSFSHFLLIFMHLSLLVSAAFFPQVTMVFIAVLFFFFFFFLGQKCVVAGIIVRRTLVANLMRKAYLFLNWKIV